MAGDPSASDPTVVASPSRARLALWLVVGLITLLAAGLRLYHLDATELWLDEACTYYYVHHLTDWPADGPVFRLEVTSVPYVGLLWGWTRLTGETAWGLRSFSVLAGVALVPLLALLARRMAGPRFGTWAAIAAALLAAVHPLHLHYSQEARVYAWWMLVMAALIGALYEAARRQSWQWWLIFLAMLCVAIPSHYYTLFWLPASIAGVVLAARKQLFLRQWVTTHVALAALMLPFVIGVVLPVRGRGSQSWLEMAWTQTPPALAWFKSWWAMLPAGRYPESYLAPLAHAAEQILGASAWVVQWLPVVVFGGLLVLFLLRMLTAKGGEPRAQTADSPTLQAPDADRSALFLLLVVGIGLAVPWLYSFVREPAYVVARYDVMVLPAVVLLIAMLLTGWLRPTPGGIGAQSPRTASPAAARRGPATLALILLIACAGVTSCGYHQVTVSSDVAERVAKLKTIVADEDIVVTLGMYRWFIVYEVDRQQWSPEIGSFPPAHDQQVGWQQPEAELQRPAQIRGDAVNRAREVQQALEAGQRVWLLALGDATGPRFQIDIQFYQALLERGMLIEPRDEWLGLAQVVLAPPDAAKDGAP
jgi:uncharacterized membrane protein